MIYPQYAYTCTKCGEKFFSKLHPRYMTENNTLCSAELKVKFT